MNSIWYYLLAYRKRQAKLCGMQCSIAKAGCSYKPQTDPRNFLSGVAPKSYYKSTIWLS
jgi:hypothetical protein